MKTDEGIIACRDGQVLSSLRATDRLCLSLVVGLLQSENSNRNEFWQGVVVFMNTFRLGVVMLLVAGSLQGCAILVVGGAAGGGYYVAKDKRSINEITADARITYAINAKYLKDDLVSPVDVDVDTYEGVVTLQGMVDNPATARRAYDLAYSVEGVKQVISKLTIRSQAMTPWGPVER